MAGGKLAPPSSDREGAPDGRKDRGCREENHVIGRVIRRSLPHLVKAKNLVLDRPVVKVEGACRENDPTKCFTGNDLLAVADECIRAPDQQSRRDDVEHAIRDEAPARSALFGNGRRLNIGRS